MLPRGRENELRRRQVGLLNTGLLLFSVRPHNYRLSG